MQFLVLGMFGRMGYSKDKLQQENSSTLPMQALSSGTIKIRSSIS